MRGIVTLPLRLEKHASNALEVARFLESQDRVTQVRYPGLPSHPQHEVAKKQMSGFSGMMNFTLDCELLENFRFIEKLELITHAVSLGHDQSLSFCRAYPLDVCPPTDDRPFFFQSVRAFGNVKPQLLDKISLNDQAARLPRYLIFYLPTAFFFQDMVELSEKKKIKYWSLMGDGVFRFSVGIENPADIIEDLERALASLAG
jgi:cystathionine beta-lyase/cystathionine gamma-synthase